MKRNAILFENEELPPSSANPYHRDHRQGTNRKDKEKEESGSELTQTYQKCVK